MDRLKRWVGALLRRWPWLGWLAQRVMKRLQPRVTIGVVGVVLDASGERVLLVEHIFHPRHPWGLPGGWMSRGETPVQTVEREIQEETGLQVHAVRPLCIEVTPAMRRHLDVVYLCALGGGEQAIRLSAELLDYRWARPDDLPPLMALQARAIRAAFDRD